MQALKSLTPEQQNYAQIEKEMLTIIFGHHKFHDCIYGLPHISVETDNKPLESILRKPIHAAPARLQRMIMSVQRYTIQVSYKPGKELLVADTLSRSPLPDLADDLEYPTHHRSQTGRIQTEHKGRPGTHQSRTHCPLTNYYSLSINCYNIIHGCARVQ